MWLLDYDERDFASDLRVFHRVNKPEKMWGPDYFALVVRLGAYQGVIAARIAAEEQSQSGSSPKAPPPATGGSQAPRPRTVKSGATVTKVEGTRAALMSNPATADLFDWD